MALRKRAMGSAWTTIHLLDRGEGGATELLGLPHDRYTEAGPFPIDYTIGTDFQPAERLPLGAVLHWDSW